MFPNTYAYLYPKMGAPPLSVGGWKNTSNALCFETTAVMIGSLGTVNGIDGIMFDTSELPR
jgi:hypothetical protein